MGDFFKKILDSAQLTCNVYKTQTNTKKVIFTFSNVENSEPATAGGAEFLPRTRTLPVTLQEKKNSTSDLPFFAPTYLALYNNINLSVMSLLKTS